MNLKEAAKFGKVQGLLKYIIRNTNDLEIQSSAREAYNYAEELYKEYNK